MAFFKEFKEFALKGNVMDMAVGVIIGGAFGKIVSSLVNDILMPPIGALIGNADFSNLRIDLSRVRDVTSEALGSVAELAGGGEAAAKAAEPIYWNYGAFIQQCVDFAILAFCVFLMVKLMNRLMKKRAATRPHRPHPRRRSCCLRRSATCSGSGRPRAGNPARKTNGSGGQSARITRPDPSPSKGHTPAARRW